MFRSIKKSQLVTQANPNSSVSEAYKMIRAKLQNSIHQHLKVILIASAHTGEGKSTTAANLAAAYAMEGKKVILVDADLRRPTIHQIFSKSNRNGLSNILQNQCKSHEAIRDTHLPGLSIIPSGTLSVNPSELLSSEPLSLLFKELKMSYDLIVVDSPPMLGATDSQVLAARCDGVILVIQRGKVKSKTIHKVRVNLEYVNANILGAVLNGVDRKDKEFFYYYGSKAYK